MKVRKHGNYEDENQVTCESCGCIFTYKKKELQIKLSYSFEEDIGKAMKFVPCPECEYPYTIQEVSLVAKEESPTEEEIPVIGDEDDG